MFGTKRRRILAWSVISSLFIFTACQEESTGIAGVTISGETQGTTYTIIIAEDSADVSKAQIDSLFHAFDMSLSTYIDSSVISQLNNATDSIIVEDPSRLIERCYLTSQHIYTSTDGAFDPSVYPLVSGWGFMNDMESPLSQPEVDSLLQFVSFENGKLHNLRPWGEYLSFWKFKEGFKLDFNAVAQGLSVDIVDEFLAARNYKNYYIEVGGEIVIRGKNREGVDWKIGIDSPEDDLIERQLENIVQLTDKAIATSGNYRKFYVHDGVKYSHTLDPKTGYPVKHSLLSATVVAKDCATADAFATAFMVMGVDKAMEFVKSHPEEQLEVYLLYDNGGKIERKMSEGFSQYLEE